MRAGFAAVDITPPLGVELSGYGYFLGRQATSVLDRLYARAICFSQPEKTVILIASDLIGLTGGLAAAVKGGLARELGLEETAILLPCSHTHTGPATVDLIACGEGDEDYLASLPGLLIQAGLAAFADLTELEQIGHMETEIEPIGFNRVEKDGPLDKKVRGLALHRQDKRPLALVHHACHPVTLGPATAISADYPGKVVAALDRQGWDGLFLNGFCGDVDPVSNQAKWGAGTSQTITAYGERLAGAFLRADFREIAANQVRLDSFEIAVALQLQRYDALMLEQEYSQYKDKGNSRAVRIWADRQIERLSSADNPYEELMQVQVMQLADIFLIGFPAEPFTKLGQIMARLLPGRYIFTLGNCNTSMRYLATEEDISRRGYAGHTSNFVYGRLPLVAGESERLAAVVADAIDSL